MSKTDALPGVTKGNQLTLEILPADDDSRISVRSQPRRPTDYVKTLPLTQPSHLEAELSSTPRFEESASVTKRKSAVRSKQRRLAVRQNQE
ncbi:unnamed protein product [Vitrella brassicaformis CCMP3155]|uniref:Uncharacterized protein n=1 Tax=Vitrella brassicaformis (strain CCMP3155) TaxID=1169540 RepID=A0A0G4FX92_VITBC|nr:unnamed protein product [Vitrella brassicaformis CCMP3155]|eukprot:CEM20008.1 unnamed protein product [Vitrella brassicaformis CCMP3155]